MGRHSSGGSNLRPSGALEWLDVELPSQFLYRLTPSGSIRPRMMDLHDADIELPSTCTIEDLGLCTRSVSTSAFFVGKNLTWLVFQSL